MIRVIKNDMCGLSIFTNLIWYFPLSHIILCHRFLHQRVLLLLLSSSFLSLYLAVLIQFGYSTTYHALYKIMLDSNRIYKVIQKHPYLIVIRYLWWSYSFMHVFVYCQIHIYACKCKMKWLVVSPFKILKGAELIRISSIDNELKLEKFYLGLTMHDTIIHPKLDLCFSFWKNLFLFSHHLCQLLFCIGLEHLLHRVLCAHHPHRYWTLQYDSDSLGFYAVGVRQLATPCWNPLVSSTVAADVHLYWRR